MSIVGGVLVRLELRWPILDVSIPLFWLKKQTKQPMDPIYVTLISLTVKVQFITG
jgi:hypothetical protein